jgi:MYXO-CTERM domain-containing protein
MKKVSTILSVLMLSALMSIHNPVVAQTSNNTTETTATRDMDRDDTGKWGLAGLLGLLGLLGLRRKNDDDVRRTTTVNR